LVAGGWLLVIGDWWLVGKGRLARRPGVQKWDSLPFSNSIISSPMEMARESRSDDRDS
jgi:hypothetical protein